TQKQVRSRVDEEVDALLLGRRADGGDAPRLPGYRIKAGAFDDPVFEINPDYAQVEQTGNVLGKPALVLVVPALEVDGHGEVNRVHDPSDDLLYQTDRDGFAVSVALSLRDRPAAGRDGLRSRLRDRPGGAGVPGVVEQQRRAFDVERGEPRGLLTLFHLKSLQSLTLQTCLFQMLRTFLWRVKLVCGTMLLSPTRRRTED